MKILCCYVMKGHKGSHLRPATYEAIQKFAPDTEMVNVQGRDQTLYWKEIRKHWNGTEDLMIIEQDNEIDARVVPEFESCPHDWCTFAYLGKLVVYGEYQSEVLDASLGCVRFSAAFQRRFPKDMIAGDSMVWHLIDFRMCQLFKRLHGCVPHVHGIVKHHHEYGSAEDFDWGWELLPDGKKLVVWRDKDTGEFKREVTT